MKKLIAFDLDGTLLHTLKDLSNAVNHALNYFNYPNKSLEEVRKAIGNGVRVLIQRCIPDGINNPNYQEVLRIFRECYKEHYKDNTLPYNGMLKTLLTLKDKGYKLAVITNKLDYISKDLINYFYPNIFDYIQGDVDGLKKKPDAEMFNHVLKELNINNDEALYVGDTNVDYDFAFNSNVDVILVTYGYRTKKEMDEYHYKVTQIQSPLELLNYI